MYSIVRHSKAAGEFPTITESAAAFRTSDLIRYTNNDVRPANVRRMFAELI